MTGHRGQSFRRGLHYIAARGAVDVHVYKAGRRGKPARLDFSRARRQDGRGARPDPANGAVLHQNQGVWNFFLGRERAPGVDGQRGHASSYSSRADAETRKWPGSVRITRQHSR